MLPIWHPRFERCPNPGSQGEAAGLAIKRKEGNGGSIVVGSGLGCRVNDCEHTLASVRVGDWLPLIEQFLSAEKRNA